MIRRILMIFDQHLEGILVPCITQRFIVLLLTTIVLSWSAIPVLSYKLNL